MNIGELNKAQVDRYISLEGVLLVLKAAPRYGAQTDDPEGSRHVKISETLVRQMVKAIEAYIFEGVAYLTQKSDGE